MTETPSLAAYLDQLVRFARGLGVNEAAVRHIVDEAEASSTGSVEQRISEVRRRLIEAADRQVNGAS